MELFQHLWTSFLRVGNEVLDVLENGTGYLELEETLQKCLDDLGRDILKMTLEAADARLREGISERPGWVVERKNETKSVLTPFGQLTYERTYFQHKQTREYAHLVDRMAGFEPHCRIDAATKGILVEAAANQSYRKSGATREVSGQTVLKAVRSFCGQRFDVSTQAQEEAKRRCRFIYVEADEDHVANQHGRSLQVPLVYVHEGVTGSRKRRKLKEARYFSGPYADLEDLWFDVLDYIDSRYDVESLEHIFVAGDGASWIRAGARLLPKSVFVLDRFHLKKWITAAVGTNRDWQKRMWEALRWCDRKAVKEVLHEAFELADTPTRKQAIVDCKRYIGRNWDGIEAYREHAGEVLGCSAEGHVSHVLSSRLSSRPSAWTKLGAGQMAQLRVMQANGQRIRQTYLAKTRANSVALLKVCKKAIARQREQLQLPWPEQLGNLPALAGHRTFLTRALKGLSFSA